MKQNINGIEMFLSDCNCSHKTKDVIKCEFCGKRTKRAVVIKIGNKYTVVGFNCEKGCFNKALEIAFLDNEVISICEIVDILYEDRKETRKTTRSEMTLKLRFEVMKRDNFQCVLCGRRPPEVELVIDHIKPVCNGGTNVKENLRTLCFECNAGKGGRE